MKNMLPNVSLEYIFNISPENSKISPRINLKQDTNNSDVFRPFNVVESTTSVSHKSKTTS